VVYGGSLVPGWAAKSKTGSSRNRLLKLLHKLLHNRFPERPETHQDHFKSPILHNNIRKVGSFRNRQVASSTLALGSKKSKKTNEFLTPVTYR
jgi:hypothetical protein